MAPRDEAAVVRLYNRILDAWNRRAAAEFAASFAATGSIVGFDGSQADGRESIEDHLAPIFRDHPTPAFVSKVREVRSLAPEAALLRAVTGLIPSGHDDIKPDLNAIQTLVAIKQGDEWFAELLHTTPAAFHGRPELAEELTAELRAELATP